MADNIQLSSGSGGDTLAADDISSVKHQRVKVQHGAANSATDVSTASPLPVELDSQAITALLHSITAKLATDALQNGLTALTPNFAKIDLTASGDLVSLVAGKKIRVLLVVSTLGGTTPTMTFQSGGSTALTGAMTASINTGFCPLGQFETASGEKLDLFLAGTTPTAKGYLLYVEV